VWTDDYSNIVGAMLRNLKKKAAVTSTTSE